MKDRYSDINPNEFTQKDLMLHLLHVSQHTVTREELKEDVFKVESNLIDRMDKLDVKIDKVEANLNEKIDKLDAKIDKVEANLNDRMNKLDSKIDKVEENLKYEISKQNVKFEEIDQRFNKLENTIHSSKVDTIKWIVSMFFANIIAMAGLGFGAFKLFGH